MSDLRLGLLKNSPLPLYYQLKQSILAAIQDGSLQPGELLPGEQDLCQQYGISRSTVRQAMGELVSEGFLERYKGRGTFVAQPKIDGRFLNKLQSFDEELRQKGLMPSTEVISLKNGVIFTRAAERLGLKPEEPLLYLERLRFANGEPVVYLETYLPAASFQLLAEVDFEQESLYGAMRSRYGVEVVRAHREIEAVAATTREAGLLGLPRGGAVCLVKSVAYDTQEKPVEYSVARYRGDRTKFSVELYR